MTERKGRPALMMLRWALGLVILAESARFFFSHAAAQSFARTGMPGIVRLGLAGCEMAAALLFLLPGQLLAGGRFLMAVLAIAIAIHVLHGWFDVGGLVVYLTAAWAVMEASPQAGRS
ncbi:MAG: hypothetical protein WB817_15895 [Terriglobales bacterium]